MASKYSREGAITVGVYLIEALALVVALCLYRMDSTPSFGDFLRSAAGLIFVGALAGGALITAVVGWWCYREWRSGSRKWVLSILMNGIVVASLLLVTEGVVRLAVEKRRLGEDLVGRLLYPRQWDRVAAMYQDDLTKARARPTYVIPDETLGWTIGPSRSSDNGLDFSSVEGLRSGTVGVSLKKNMTGCRIAVVGDSYTFGQHVAYDRTWVHLLEEGLDSKCQVLNFGVGGYGVDQMYLRYQKDIRSWSPDIVVLAFIEDDATRRSLAVYSFLLFPDGTMPFVKPRFALRNGELNVVNYPLASSDEVFATPSIHELPFIEYDYNYRATEWNRAAWRYLNGSYAFRLLLSLHPPYEPERPEISREEAKAINRELFLRFTENVRADGALPVVVHLPTDMDFPIPPGAPLSLQILRDANIPHLDLRRCLSERDPADIFRPIEKGGHYSEEGNRQVAQCLLDPIRAQLDARAVRNRGHSPPIRMVVP